MMKKFIKCFSILLCVLLLCLTFASCLEKENTNEESFVFKLEDYKSFTNSFRREINIGKIEDADDAVSKAEKLFIETFGQEDMEDEKPYQAFFDEENNCWYVKGTFHQNSSGTKKGGVAKVIFDSEGNVLALWHEK